MVVDLSVEARGAFMMKVYTHLLGALIAFISIEVAIFSLELEGMILQAFGGVSWLVVLGAFMVISWMATRAAHSAQTRVGQYLGLAAYVLAMALITVPLLAIAEGQSGAEIITYAAYVSLAGFTGLSAIAIISRKDFSFLRSALMWGGFCAIGLIAASVFMGFQLGLMFNIGMVALAGAAILYDTQKIFHEYPEDRYVGASLQLFASIAMMFWYILRIFMSRD
jgi:uncharacterized protein